MGTLTAFSECQMLFTYAYKKDIFNCLMLKKEKCKLQTCLLLQHQSSSRQTIPSAIWISSLLMLILRISSGILHQRHGGNILIQSTYYRVGSL